MQRRAKNSTYIHTPTLTHTSHRAHPCLFPFAPEKQKRYHGEAGMRRSLPLPPVLECLCVGVCVVGLIAERPRLCRRDAPHTA